jgi:serine/threonine protein kinase
VGKTADGRPYYKRWAADGLNGKFNAKIIAGEILPNAAKIWYYIYFDQDCSAGRHREFWVLNKIRPSITAIEMLDGDDTCSNYGVSFFTESTTPLSGEWRLICAGERTPFNITIGPAATVVSTTADGAHLLVDLAFNTMVEGSCGYSTNEWTYAGTTATTKTIVRPFYRWYNEAASVWRYIFYDDVCADEKWIIGESPAEFTANMSAQSFAGTLLDNAPLIWLGVPSTYSYCTFSDNLGYTTLPYTFGEEGFTASRITPPSFSTWRILCDGTWLSVPITIAPFECLTTPSYTYTLSFWEVQQTIDAIRCGATEHRDVLAVDCSVQRRSCCTNHSQPPTAVRTQPACPTKEAYPNVVLSGVPASLSALCVLLYNGRWMYTGRTADLRPFYSRPGLFWKYYLYFDADCGGTGALDTERWVIKNAPPNTTALFDLAPDGGCNSNSVALMAGSSFTPPSKTIWNMHCPNADLYQGVIDITPDCSPTPESTYNWGEWVPEQTDGTTCGHLDRRIATEVCSAAPGCCINKQPTPQRRPQSPCLTDGANPNIVLSGVPDSCHNGYLNREWTYVGGPPNNSFPYYKTRCVSFVDCPTRNPWLYLYFNATRYEWHIVDTDPHTIIVAGTTTVSTLVLDEMSSRLIMPPPSGVSWSVDCDSAWTPTTLNIITPTTTITSTTTSVTSTTTTIPPEYPNFIMSGVPQSCYDGVYNGEWLYGGYTPNLQPYYKWWSEPFSEWRFLLHHDGRWFISLDQTTDNIYKNHVGRMETPIYATSFAPPSGVWILEECTSMIQSLDNTTIASFPLTVSYPNVVVSGDATSCSGASYTGEWKHMGLTTDGHPFYKKIRTSALYTSSMYLYYDRNCIEDTLEFQSGRRWLIHLKPPDKQHAGGKCEGYLGITYVNSTSFAPPTRASWQLLCNDFNSTLIVNIAIVDSKEARNWSPCAEQGAICFCDGTVLHGLKYAEDGADATYDVMVNRPHRIKKMTEGILAVACTETWGLEIGSTLPNISVPHQCICRSMHNAMLNGSQAGIPPFSFRSNGSDCNATSGDSSMRPPQPCESAHIVLYFDGMSLFNSSSMLVEEVERSGARLECHDEYSFKVPFLFQSEYFAREIMFQTLVDGGNVTLVRTEVSPTPDNDELRAVSNIHIPIVCAIALPSAMTVSLNRSDGAIGTWINLCQTVLKPNVTHDYTFGPKKNTPAVVFARDACTLLIVPCTSVDFEKSQEGPCYKNAATVTAELGLTESISGVRGSFGQLGAIGRNPADDCTGDPLDAERAKYGIGNHHTWNQQVKNHDGITVFGTPDKVLYGGCEAGQNFNAFKVAIRETNVPESNVLMVQCAQTSATETVVYNFNEIEVLVFREPAQPIAMNTTTKQSANTAATGGDKQSTKRRAALGATIAILALVVIGVAVWVVRRRRAKQASTENQITDLIVNGAVTLVASAFAHMFVHDGPTSAHPNQRQAAAEYMHSWLADHQASKRAIVCGATLGVGSHNRETRRGELRLKAARILSKTDVVVKICNLSDSDGNQRVIKQFCAEALLVGGLRHPNILGICNMVTNSLPFMVVSEWMAGGDLQLYLRSCRSTNKHCKEVLRLKELLSIASRIVLACEFLEEHKMIHRALMSSNVLVGENHLDIRLTGFGSLREVLRSEEYVQMSDKKDTQLDIRFMALESFTDNTFSVKSDVWAFGVMLWEVLSFARKPYGTFHPSEIAKEVRSGRRLDPVDGCPEELSAAMEQCWLVDAASRPTFASLQGTLRLIVLEDAAILRTKVKAATKLTDRNNAHTAALNLPMRGWSNVEDDPGVRTEVVYALSCVSVSHPDLIISELRQAAGPAGGGRRVTISSTSIGGTAQLKTAVAMRCELAHRNLLPFLGTTHSIAGGYAALFGINRPSTTLQSALGTKLGADPDSEILVGMPLTSQLALQMALGIEYVHANGCVHGGLALDAFSVDMNNTVRLLFLDSPAASRLNGFVNKSEAQLTYGSNMRWMPHESFQDKELSYSTDVWSFGVLLWQVYLSDGSNRHPHAALYPTDEDLIAFVSHNNALPLLEVPVGSSLTWSEEVHGIYKACLEKLEPSRPSMMARCAVVRLCILVVSGCILDFTPLRL